MAALKKKDAKQTQRTQAEPRQHAVTPQEVRARAYQMYLERKNSPGNTPGDAVSDWLRAERELNGARDAPAAVTGRVKR